MALSKNASVEGFPSDFAWGAATAAYQIEGTLIELSQLIVVNSSF